MEINAYNANPIAKSSNSLSKNKSSLQMDDFLNLLVSQMKNQDALNPMDNTEFVSQLAQFSSLQSMNSIQEMTKQSQATSLIGKTIVVANYDNIGNVVVKEGAVEKVTIHGGETLLYVNGEAFNLSNVMEIKTTESTNSVEEKLGKILEKIASTNQPQDEINQELVPEAEIEINL